MKSSFAIKACMIVHCTSCIICSAVSHWHFAAHIERRNELTIFSSVQEWMHVTVSIICDILYMGKLNNLRTTENLKGTWRHGFLICVIRPEFVSFLALLVFYTADLFHCVGIRHPTVFNTDFSETAAWTQGKFDVMLPIHDVSKLCSPLLQILQFLCCLH